MHCLYQRFQLVGYWELISPQALKNAALALSWPVPPHPQKERRLALRMLLCPTLCHPSCTLNSFCGRGWALASQAMEVASQLAVVAP